MPTLCLETLWWGTREGQVFFFLVVHVSSLGVVSLGITVDTHCCHPSHH